MNFKSFNWSFIGAVIAAILLMASATAFAQAPDGKADDIVTPATSDKLLNVKAEKVRTFSTYAEYSADTTNKKEDPTDTVDTTAIKVAQGSSAKKWDFAFAPYLYLSGISGTVEARGRTATIDQSIGDVLSHFKAGFMGSFMAHRGRFVMYDDLIWVKLTEETNTPGGLYDTGKVSVNMTIIDPQAGVRVVENKAGSFDILGGIRVTSVKTILSFTAGTLPGFSVEQRKSWAAPTIGGHGLLNLSPKVYLSTFFDVGGGFGTHVTGQFYGGLGYRIKPKVALVGGYRYIKNDYSDDTGFVYNTNMNGLVLGANFRL